MNLHFMNKKKAASLAIILLLIIFIACVQTKIFTGEASQNIDGEKKYTATFFDVFDTSTEITAYSITQEDFSSYASDIHDRLVYYNNLYDIYNDYDGINNIKTINDNAGIEAVEVSDDVINLLKFGKEVYSLTDGRVNIAMGSVLSIWHEYREYGLDNPDAASLPDIAELEQAAKHTNIDDLLIDEVEKTVYLNDKAMSLDVGSIAKGYAVQQVADYVRYNGIDNVLFSVGGNILGLGGRGDGTSFRIAIQNPDLESSEPYIEKVTINDGQCLVSSGDYQRYYVVDGKVYCHIINPDTLFPADTFAAVSVLADDSGLADALSTALFTMTLEDGLELINDSEIAEAMWVYHDGTRVYSNHFEEYIIE